MEGLPLPLPPACPAAGASGRERARDTLLAARHRRMDSLTRCTVPPVPLCLSLPPSCLRLLSRPRFIHLSHLAHSLPYPTLLHYVISLSAHHPLVLPLLSLLAFASSSCIESSSVAGAAVASSTEAPQKEAERVGWWSLCATLSLLSGLSCFLFHAWNWEEAVSPTLHGVC